MNNKLKKAIAIIALILILIFTVSFILYLFDKTMLNGAIGSLAIWSGGFGFLLVAVLWISHAFPYQQQKDAERERLYKEAEEQDEKERAESDAKDNNSDANENDLTKDDLISDKNEKGDKSD